ncbi:MAG: imidazole glycerol phosphate synthase subunit HisH [Bacteroidaceae bacterium]|nr:imidazole glycerol phosphate synthase subunit HisH [Bacteroidaceae bacterium]MBQ2073776.1 imidazole glycerol phosphate synthase subunit HisH [Bacteroidaceae bacterium]MBR0183250.1 imidazole glycerol phosphate synthase subunit HisH [Bacteroidaceae bacterium]
MMIAVVKYNAGNIRSVLNALNRLGVEPVLTDDAEALRNAERVLFPGQGEAATAMAYLRERGLDRVICSLRQPVLGICIGQQLMCSHSEEGNTDCLGIFPMEVVRFQPQRHEDKVPQMGWNSIHNLKTRLFDGVDEGSFIYNVHSFYVPESPYTIASCEYILPYSAALNKDNFYSTQFHPEKSGSVGEQILKNFLKL